MLQPICQDSTDKSHKFRTQQQNSYYVAQKQAHNTLKITPLNLKLDKLPKQIKKRSFHHQLPIAVQHLKHFKVATNICQRLYVFCIFPCCVLKVFFFQDDKHKLVFIRIVTVVVFCIFLFSCLVCFVFSVVLSSSHSNTSYLSSNCPLLLCTPKSKHGGPILIFVRSNWLHMQSFYSKFRCSLTECGVCA